MNLRCLRHFNIENWYAVIYRMLGISIVITKKGTTMDLDIMREMMAKETSDVVRLWMNWMMLIFFASLTFIAKFKPARVTFIAIIVTVFFALITWMLTKNIHLFGVPHLIVWTPLAWYLWSSVLSTDARIKIQAMTGVYSKVYFVWVCLLFVTIIVSLVFDVRDVFLVMTGVK